MNAAGTQLTITEYTWLHINSLQTAKPLQWLRPCPVITCQLIELEHCSIPLKKQKVS